MGAYESDLRITQKIAEEVAARGGRTYYVGGYVRDRLRQCENKDIDIEVHGIAPEVLEEILDGLGERITIGECFGIYNLKGCGVDIAMPRMEYATGRGHRDFQVFVDPFAGTEKAAVRRDFTINAMMQDVISGELVDHFGGEQDLRDGVIRHVSSETFPEDPLRVLRAAQFAARFGMVPAQETVELCRRMDLAALPKERIMGELEKAMLKADRPSVFFEVLREMDQLETWFPELVQLIGLRQDPIYHKEGDVWTHSMMVLDQAAAFREKTRDPLGFMLSALCHDLGKIVCFQEENGRIHAYGHEEEGLPLVETFMDRLTGEKKLTAYVLDLVACHMKPNTMAHDNSAVKATNKMFDRSVDPEALIYLAVSDSWGMIPPAGDAALRFLMERLAVYREYMARPYVTGQDILDMGVPQGKQVGELMEYAHKLRLAGVPREEALKQVRGLARLSP